MIDPKLFADQFEAIRTSLTTYLVRLVLRVALAEEMVQETALRALQNLKSIPSDEGDFRAWVFRVATNLALDHRRRHGTVRETVMLDLRQQAENNEGFSQRTETLRGSPESVAIAREHLSACLACCLHRFPSPQGAALLLVEMVGFTVAETAMILEARPAQIKGWLTATRKKTEEHFGSTCALVTKQGICYQCIELDGFYRANQGDPLAGSQRSIDDRLEILRVQKPAQWTKLLGELLEELV